MHQRQQDPSPAWPHMRLNDVAIATDPISTGVALFPSRDADDDAPATLVAVTAVITIAPTNSPTSSPQRSSRPAPGRTRPPTTNAAHVILDPTSAAHALITSRAAQRFRYLVPDGAEVSLKLNRNEAIEVNVSPGDPAA